MVTENLVVTNEWVKVPLTADKNAVIQNVNSYSNLEVAVTTAGNPTLMSGMLLMPLEKLTVIIETGEQMLARTVQPGAECILVIG